MRRLLVLPVVGLFLAAMLPLLASAADMVTRKVVQVPKVDPAVMTIDGQMNEAAWATAAQANIVTSTGFEMYAYYYGRDLPEPDFEELYGRMLWAKDTLYVF